jgi:HK97 family phage prohead protease
MELERKTFVIERLELKGGADSVGSGAGYAATFGNKDLVGDIILKDAFADTLDDFVTNGVILARHGNEHQQPVASIKAARPDDHGVWIEWDFHSTPAAQAERTIAQERLERGKSVSLSIGYAINPGGAEYKDGVRYLKSVKLYDVSLVNIPANPLALVGAVKGADLDDGLPFNEHLEAVVDAVEEITKRAKARHEYRVKEGRVLSTANLDKIRRMHEAMTEMMPMLQDLMDAGAPKMPAEDEAPKAASEADMERLRLRLRITAAGLGLSTN